MLGSLQKGLDFLVVSKKLCGQVEKKKKKEHYCKLPAWMTSCKGFMYDIP
jgi:hypothetical protein